MTTISALRATDNYLSLSTVAEDAAQTGTTSLTNSSGSRTPAASISDSLSLSAEATVALTGATGTSMDPQVAYYAQFFPTRSGAGTIFGENILDPAATTLSTGLSGPEIAKAARASMDAEYSSMTASGQAFDFNSGVDWNTLMSGLDRTALAAVSSDQDGLFSKDEQDMAQSLMLQEEQFAIGNYAGPLNLESKFVSQPPSGQGYSFDSSDAMVSDTSNITYADIALSENLSSYLDKAGNYEKSTVQWAFGRASVQTQYEEDMDAAKQPYDPQYISNLSIVGMLSELMKNAQKIHVGTDPSVLNTTDLLNEKWAKGHEAAIEDALVSTRKELGLSGN
ncbi:hypothetical protein [Komagataeibacter sp. FNDCR2]|uniref:hypothetical protein n=1 Tax=Komagataeibacter sp. FNDCR2 TaxID=2878682 RepID=UPI001E38F01C|nr:hypothetical protein [Komagataeibacter sp. FNDCR2]MCE2574298.1 hypothetical protein [Komagataeibacter sp. FNDCR2]